MENLLYKSYLSRIYMAFPVKIHYNPILIGL